MPRPKSKSELIEASNTELEKLWGLIDSLPEEGQIANFDFGDISNKKEAHWTRDKNIRDILIHLYEWHQLLLKWANDNQQNIASPFIPEPYNWKTYGDMNVEFWKQHQNTSYEDAREMLNKSHAEVMALIDSFSDEELFTKKYFSWTGTSNLGSYCISATSSHYDWAIKKIKLHIKTYKK